MKPKTAVTLLFWVVVIAVAWAAFKRSGLDRAVGALLSPAPRGGDIGARSSPPSGAAGLLADLVAGPMTGSGPGGGPGSFGAGSSPVANSVGVVAAAVPTASGGAAPSGALTPQAATGAIGPTVATRVAQAGEFLMPSTDVVAIPVGSYVSAPGTPVIRAETVQVHAPNFFESLAPSDPRSSFFGVGRTSTSPISPASTVGAVITGKSALSLPGIGAVSLPAGFSPEEFLRRLGG